MNNGFKFGVAKNILGINTNIDHSNDAWMAMNQFNKYMGWYGDDGNLGVAQKCTTVDFALKK